ncbi:MAG TPA: ester cyclase [Pyrinomonadaceae bacterium]|nr:ester cyclase [Pyrinomonadaceae bacterium]
MSNGTTLLHRWFEEVWNQKRTSAIYEMMTEETIIHGLSGPGGPPVLGASDFEKFHSTFVSAFPDVHVEVFDVVSEGNKMACRFTVTGRQMGDLPEITATNKKVLFDGTGVCTVADGKFTEVWNVIDFPKMHYDLAPDTPDVE